MPFAVVDLSEAYGNARGTISRGVALVNNRQDVLIQDEFDLEVPRFITWGMTTDAAIEILPDGEALLTLEDKHLRAKILSPQGWKFGIGPAEQPAPQKTNKGTQRLVVRPVYETANLRLSILLTPVRQADESLTVPDVKPLSTW